MFFSQFKNSVTDLPGIGPATASALIKLGIRSRADLLLHFPRSYQDRRGEPVFRESRDGSPVSVLATVTGHGKVRLKRGGFLLKVGITDGRARGELLCFNRPFLEKSLPEGVRIALFGKFSLQRGVWQSSDFEYEPVERGRESAAFGRIVPVYPLVAGLGQKQLRRAVLSMLDELDGMEEPLPDYLIRKRKLMPFGEMVGSLHYPADETALESARANMSYIEFFIFEAALVYRRHLRAMQTSGRAYCREDWIGRLESVFGFRLTEGQTGAAREILSDLYSGAPMQRLLMGDVGSGKTAVACIALAVVACSGYQAAVAAPTVVLADQLFRRLGGYLETLGLRTAFLSGRTPAAQRSALEAAIGSGEVQVVVGTHVLFGKTVHFEKLGLVVVDEQHRFGVEQRRALLAKGEAADYLTMSATPIPRSLAMTLYGDLDISRISGMPVGRKQVITKLLGRGESEAVAFIRERLAAREQVFWVFPVIEESEKSDLEAAETAYRKLSSGELAGFGVRLLHGRMPEEEKLSVMEEFRNGRFGVLVSTTVVEVGVDNPAATVMVVSAAHRFGLSQLHQLRGRVGRGGRQGHCLLIAGGKPGEAAKQRMDIFIRETDGFRIAEADLRMRGQGDLLGSAQSGLPLFRIADPVEGLEYLETARADAAFILERDPQLDSGHNRGLRRIFTGRMGLEGESDEDQRR